VYFEKGANIEAAGEIGNRKICQLLFYKIKTYYFFKTMQINISAKHQKRNFFNGKQPVNL